MSTWTSQIGFPMISAELVETTDTVRIKVRQQKFCANGDDSSTQQWFVPISVISQSNPDKATCYLLEGKEGEILVEGAKPGDWIKVNPGLIGERKTSVARYSLYSSSYPRFCRYLI